MNVTINFKDGSKITHTQALIVGQIPETNEIVIGNGGNVTFYPGETIDSFDGKIDDVDKNGSSDLRDILSKITNNI